MEGRLVWREALRSTPRPVHLDLQTGDGGDEEDFIVDERFTSVLFTEVRFGAAGSIGTKCLFDAWCCAEDI